MNGKTQRKMAQHKYLTQSMRAKGTLTIMKQELKKLDIDKEYRQYVGFLTCMSIFQAEYNFYLKSKQ